MLHALRPRYRSVFAAALAALPALLPARASAGAPASALPPPEGVTLVTVNGQVLVSWLPVAGAIGYVVHGDLGPLELSSSPFAIAPSSPFVIEKLPGSATLQIAVASLGPGGEGPASPVESIVVAPGGAGKFFPAWSKAKPALVIEIDYNPGLSTSQNGANLKSAMQALTAGQQLLIGAGTWTVDSLLDLSLFGTSSAPIWIGAQPGAKPVITRSDASQNTVNVGQGAQARYLALRGLEIRGGDIGLRIHAASQVWIDGCDVHATANNAIAANSDPVDHLFFTRNQIHDTAGSGEGLYLGANEAASVAHDCIVAQNHVYNTGGSQGDGIEVKQGSWGNLIAENYVHDTHYPCILVYGTGGQPFNLIERNLCEGSGDAVLQVQGEAIVRNNVLADGAVGFLSTDHQDLTHDLTFVHNTIVNTGTAAKLTSWNGRPGMTFSNNACYSQAGDAIQFSGGSSGVKVTGNVAYGPVSGTSGGYALGGGLSDFVAVTWDGGLLNATPTLGGALDGAGDPSAMLLLDLLGEIRLPGLEAGAIDAP